MTKPEFLSVVIPTFNSAGTISHTLLSILSNDFPKGLYEVIVVDNGSQDNTVEIVKRFPVRLYSCPKRGQGPARNKGINQTIGNIVCFTDSDVIAPSDWLQKISDFFKKHPDADAVGGRVLPPSSGHRTLIQKWVGEVYYVDQSFPTEKTHAKICTYTGSTYSANCAYKKDALLSVNGFDESVWDGNDIDLCWTLLKKGRNIFFNPDLQIIHLGFPWNIRLSFRKQFAWGRINIYLTRIHCRHYKKRVLKAMLFSIYRIIMEMSALPSPSAKPKTKQLVRINVHLAFFLGRLLELMHPFKKIEATK
jgi:glycosyltransferase involved in cell wall biosynthesis